jgi:hypothetical protein
VLVAAALGAGATIAGGTTVVLLLRDGGSSTTPATPTPPDGTLPTATPTATVPAGGPIEPAGDRFDVATFAPGERIPWHEGVFAMDTATGAITGYRFPKPSGTDETFSQVRLVGARWVAAEGYPDAYSYLHDRDTGQSWRYSTKALRLKDASPDHLVFAEIAPVAGQLGQGTGLFRVFSPAMVEVARFELAAQGTANPSQVLMRGTAAAIIPDPMQPELVLADLATGETRTVFRPEAELEGKELWWMGIAESAADWFVVSSEYLAMKNGQREPTGSPTYLLRRIGWDGSVLEVSQTEGWYWHASVSPDGRYRISQETLFDRLAVGVGSGEVWPAVALHSIDGEPVLRIRSAATRYGDNLPRARWLADGSHFVAAFRGDTEELDRGPRYAVVGLDGEIAYLPRPPLTGEQWYQRSIIAGPVPSPHDADLLSFGRLYLYNRRTDRWFIPNLEDEGGPAHWLGEDSPWDGREGEMVFALGHGGHGGDMPPTLIEPLVEPAPYLATPAMRFTVARTGSCLNLHESWDDESPSLECLADGTRLRLDPEGAALWDDAPADARYSVAADERHTWVMVNTPAGEEGWVASEYLDWAPDAD